MAGSSVTMTEEVYGTIKKIKFVWVSDDTTGLVTGSASTNIYSGKILGLATVPGTLGVTPDNLYDVEILDDDGLDVLMGGGLDRSDVNTEYVLSTSLGAVANDHLTLAVSNAGNSKEGTVYIYIR